MSKKITEFRTVTSLETTDWLTGIDLSEVDLSLQNIKITKDDLLAGLALSTEVTQVANDLAAHEGTGAGAAHPDGTTATDLANHKAGTNEHPIASVTGLQAALDAKEDIANLGDAAYRDVGTLNTQVAAGDAPAAAVISHESTYNHANLPTTSQKAGLDAASPAISGANPAAGQANIVDEGANLKSTGEPANRYLVSDGADGFAYQDAPPAGGGGGSGFERAYTFEATTTAPPSANSVRMDSANNSLVTTIWFDDTDNNGFLLAAIASNMDEGDVITFGDAVGNTLNYRCSAAPTFGAGYWTFTVTYSSGGVTFVDATTYTTLFAAGESRGHIIQDEGIVLSQRSNLNFIGAGVTASDDESNDRTNITIPGGGGGANIDQWDIAARIDLGTGPYSGIDETDLNEQLTPGAGFKLLGWDGTELKITDVGNLPTGGGGEANLGANVGTGVDVFRDKTGVTLNFRRINDHATITWSQGADTLSAEVPANTFDNWGAAAAAVATHAGGTDVHAISGVTGLQAALDGKEPAFAKNTAFNKDFGTLVGTVCQGNDARLSDARTPTAHAASHGTGQADELTPAAIGAATAAQGALADTATQPGDDVNTLSSGAALDNYVPTADGAGNVVWEAQQGAGGGWVDGTEVTDWLDAFNTVTTAGTTNLALNTLGHIQEVTLGGDHVVNFQRTIGAGQSVSWNCLLFPASNTPTFQFNGVGLTGGTGLLPTLGTNPVMISFYASATGAYITGAAEIT